MAFEGYREAVDYLQRRLWHELPIVPVERALQHRVRQVLAHLGEPQRAFDVVHVGGSAGKGSTAAIAASVLRAAGVRTGLYTSPHLQTFIERIDVDGVLIAPERFAEIVLGLDPLVRQMHVDVLDGKGYGRPALVEVAFAAGMRHFADEGVQAAVVEVGLGGRTDCTNVFEAKRASVITNIEEEHRERLGWTIRSIAREKAAIIRAGDLAVTGTRQPEALTEIERRCDEVGAELWRLGREVRVRVRAADEDGVVVDLKTPAVTVEGARVALRGGHQARNAALAVAATTARPIAGQCVTADDVRRGLAAVRVSARLERVQERPRVLLDGAHNPVEAQALVEELARVEAARGRVHLVCGILADKDQPAMARTLARVASSVVVTAPPLEERAGDPERLVTLFRRHLAAEVVTFEPRPQAALEAALSRAGADDAVVVAGSMYLAGALRGRWVAEERILERRSTALA